MKGKKENQFTLKKISLNILSLSALLDVRRGCVTLRDPTKTSIKKWSPSYLRIMEARITSNFI